MAADQQTTRQWWTTRREEFELAVSAFVVDECAAGDPTAAAERLEYLQGIRELEASDDVWRLAAALISGIPLPEKAAIDAAHIASSAVHGIEYLLTWNCKHIANPAFRPRIERICREHGFEPPVICTPNDMMEFDGDYQPDSL